ncbi:hypothetical protein CAPTEDRAFT_218689 [Capitella teleta]|uniref:BACK domain-containing protein n=1 Tax=Capitella teleta TaxID=283909 RepID=R7VHU3_CAPTE|nr:hypothetical protein CAPTEDRAFT_218689 [Capitella teleta]|eukprot:ELU18164.1 hypothetical protein CAPTEDRAFT_218689 [Capitella teleta]
MVESLALEVTIGGIDHHIGLIIVDYIYSGVVKITKDNAEDLLRASDQLLLFELKTLIEGFMLNYVEVSNCIGFLIFSKVFHLQNLTKKSYDCLLDNFSDVTTSSEEIGQLQDDLLAELLMDDGLNVPNENCVFEFVTKWYRNVPGRSRTSFLDMVTHVRLPFCTDEYFSSIVHDELVKCLRGSQLIQDATERHRVNQHIIQIRRPRRSYAQHSLVIGNDTRIWQRGSDVTDDWYEMEDIPFNCRYYSACSTPDGFIVTGGCNESSIALDCKRGCYWYIAHENHWRILPPMSKGRSDHSSVYHNHTLYVVGGDEDHSFQSLDTNSLKWSTLPSMPDPVYRAHMAVFKGRIFVLGGKSSYMNFRREVHEYSSAACSWQERKSMPEVCSYGAVVGYGEHIFVVGGQERCCMRYDPEVDSWLRLQRPLHVHRWGPALEWKAKIVVCGGCNADSIEEYDPQLDMWSVWQLTVPYISGMVFALKV